jgi:adenylate cyclase
VRRSNTGSEAPSLRGALLNGLVGGVLAILLGWTAVGESIELRGYDLLHLFGTAARPSKDIVIVGIDEPSFAELGLRWPWPRSLHGKLVERLREAGASVVGFDILFPEPSAPSEDDAFAASLGKGAAVVLASDVEVVRAKNYTQEIRVEPLPLFAGKARTGVAAVAVDRDHVVRRTYPLREGETGFAEAIASAHAGKAAGRAPEGSFIAYAGPPGTYPAFSYYQALDPPEYLPPGALRGKIVLVGRILKTSPDVGRSGNDIFPTPHLFAGAPRLMNGVEIQANLVDGFLNRRFVARLGGPATACLYLLAGLLGGLLQRRWRPLRSGLLTILAAAAFLAAAFLLFRNRLLWIPAFLSLPAFGVPYALSGAQAYLRSEAKRREIRKAFSHYLSPAVLESLLADPEKVSLTGRTVEATVLFCDIAGFTTLSENLPPEEVARLLNRHFDEMTRIVLEHRGTVDKFIGDEIMAFWGDPVPDPDHAFNACAAAVAMQERLAALRKEAGGGALSEVRVRIGINTGRVIAGNMGSSDLFNYTVLGDAVNTASRLVGANKERGTSVLISASTRERAGDRIKARPLEPVAVRGKSRPVEVYELTGA